MIIVGLPQLPRPLGLDTLLGLFVEDPIPAERVPPCWGDRFSAGMDECELSLLLVRLLRDQVYRPPYPLASISVLSYPHFIHSSNRGVLDFTHRKPVKIIT